MSLKSWRGSQVCTTNAGSQATILGSSSTPRPNPPCPSGYHACGQGTYDANYATCAPDSETGLPWPTAASPTGCPLTYLGSNSTVSNTADLTAAKFGTNQVRSTPFAATGGMIFAAAGLDLVKGLPVVELTTAFVDLKNFKGPCFADATNVGLFTASDQGAYAGAGDAQDNKYHSACTTQDKRWMDFDTYSEASLLQENFKASAVCTGMTVLEIQNSDYFASNIKCTNSAAKTGQKCLSTSWSGASTVACGSDVTCQMTFYQSQCGQLYSHATANSASKSVGMFYRNQMYWKSGEIGEI